MHIPRAASAHQSGVALYVFVDDLYRMLGKHITCSLVSIHQRRLVTHSNESSLEHIPRALYLYVSECCRSSVDLQVCVLLTTLPYVC